MALFKKKADPISERTRALQKEIAALEKQIGQLHERAAAEPRAPRFRTTARPENSTSLPPRREPALEPAPVPRAQPAPEPENTPAHYNDLGVRKYDIVAAWRRLKNHFTGPPVANPKLVTYLASGGIQGLRPLRYEKRVARNRFFALLALLILVLYGIISFLARGR